MRTKLFLGLLVACLSASFIGRAETVLYMMQTVPSALVNTPVPFETRSSFATVIEVGIGHGTKQDGSDWAWDYAALSSGVSWTNTVVFGSTGVYYYGAYWMDFSDQFYGWNEYGQTDQYDLTAIDSEGYAISIVLPAAPTNVVAIMPAGVSTVMQGTPVEFQVSSWSNVWDATSVLVGYGASADMATWTTWDYAALSNAASPYWATNQMVMATAGTFYYGAQWKDEGGNNCYCWNEDGQTNEFSPGTAQYTIVVNPPAVPTNVVSMREAVSAALQNEPVAFQACGLSNAVSVRIGYGPAPDDTTGWTWVNAAVSNDTSPYVATNHIVFPATGEFYYAVEWNDGVNTCYGWDDEGQTNAFALDAEYTIDILPRAIATNVVSMIEGPSGATCNMPVEFETRSLSNGTVKIGWGESTDGSGWSWVDASVYNASSPYIATNYIAFPATGDFYYAAEWIVGGTNYVGWDVDGQTNTHALAARYSIQVFLPAEATNVVFQLRALQATQVHSRVGFLTTSWTNSTSATGRKVMLGTTQDGTGWTNLNAFLLPGSPSNGVYWGQTQAIMFDETGRFYYASYWIIDGRTNYGWNSQGQTNQFSFSQAEYYVDIVLRPMPSNQVQMMRAQDSAVQYSPVPFETRSWSNGVVQVGYGASQDGSDWVWTGAAVSNPAGPSPYVAAADIAFTSTGVFYYAACWTLNMTNDWYSGDTNYFGWNETGQINEFNTNAEYSITITAPATRSNTVYMTPAIAATVQNARVFFSTTSVSNGTARIGFGTSQDGSGWAWSPAVVTNAAGPSPYVATNTILMGATGTFYYGACWVFAGNVTNFGWNDSGQINEFAPHGEYQIRIAANAAATNVVSVVQSLVLTTAPNVKVLMQTLSLSNGTAQIGYGTSQDGSGWRWVNAAVTNAAGPAPYVATNAISISTTGAFYYAARWSAPGLGTNYGSNADGQTNAAAPDGEYAIVISLDMVPIAVARAFGPGALVQVGPFTLSTTNKMAPSGNYMICGQDSNAGVSIYGTIAQVSIIIATKGLEPGSSIAVLGSNVVANGLYQLQGVVVVTNYGNVGLPAARPITFEDLTNGAVAAEENESMLVALADVNFTNTGSLAYADYRVSNTDTSLWATVRIASQTDPLIGPAIPTIPCDVTGIVSQADSTAPFDGGYNVLALGIEGVPEPVAGSVAAATAFILIKRRRR